MNGRERGREEEREREPETEGEWFHVYRMCKGRAVGRGMQKVG